MSGLRRSPRLVRRAAILTVLAVAAALRTSAAAGAEEGEVLRRWTFRSAEDLRGWEAGNGISGLRVEEGRLRGRLTHSDAYLFAPPLRVPLDGLVVRVRWSCPRGGGGQCYFATREAPSMGEDRVVSREVEGGRMVETEFPLGSGDGSGAAAPPTLTRFRLDPFNGNEGVDFEIEEVTLVRLPPRFETAFAPARASVGTGEAAEFRVRLRPLGGRRIGEAFEATVTGGSGPPVTLTIAPGNLEASCRIPFSIPGVHPVRAALSRGGRTIEELETAIAVGLSAEPVGPRLEGSEAMLELLSDAGAPERYRAARLRAQSGAGRWREAGLLLPLAELVTPDSAARRRRYPPLALAAREERRMLLRSEADPEGFRVDLEFGFEVDRGGTRQGEPGELIAVRAALSGPPGKGFLRFAGPAFRRSPGGRDPLDRFAIFGGLEFLEPGWASSSERAVGPKFAARWNPHPLKICLPVMALEAEGLTTAVLWNPAGSAAGGGLLAATFASPNFLEGQPDHLLALSLPPVGPDLEENETLARRPVVPETGRAVISFGLATAADRPVLWAARRWYEHYGIPEPPPFPHDLRTTWDLLARSLGETVWWPEEKGWRSHWFLAERGHYRPDLAAELILHSKLTGERRWVEATGLDAKRPLIEVAGLLWDRAAAEARGAEAAVASMREDGIFLYHETPQVSETVRRHTAGRFGNLGEEGSTSLGTCVQRALPLLRHLVASGDAKFLEPAVKALKAMRRFRVPRGAQVWEVHQDIPDIRAAALAVEAYRLGYLATGEAAHLDDAFYWAEAGLPFVFAWRAPSPPDPAAVRTSADRNDAKKSRSHPARDLFQSPRRQVTPYGTIPVLGPTFYVVNWFGVLVQWCGLEWAWKVLDLCDLREDPLLRAAAEGVARSGLQQMFDREPWTGLYPDVWDLRGNWAGGALLHPHLLIEALRAGGRLPQALRVWTRRAGEGRDALLVHGRGRPVKIGGGPQGLKLTLGWIPGEPAEILIARSPRPRAVTAAGIPIPEGGQGYRYDAARKLLGIRFVPAGEEVAIEVGYRD